MTSWKKGHSVRGVSHRHLKAALKSNHSPRTLIKAKPTITTLRAVDKALHDAISFTRAGPWPGILLLGGDPWQMAFKRGCPTPLQTPPAQAFSARAGNAPALGGTAWRRSCFSWQLSTCMKLGCKWRTDSRRPPVQVQPQLRLAPAHVMVRGRGEKKRKAASFTKLLLSAWK